MKSHIHACSGTCGLQKFFMQIQKIKVKGLMEETNKELPLAMTGVKHSVMLLYR